MKMQLACGCCRQLKAVTIKGIDKLDGTTVWEYGPGSFWRHHYSIDEISGVVPNLSATLNKYAIVAAGYPAFNNCGNRNSGTLSANVCEALSLVKLDSLDGTTIESATLTGMFCDGVEDTSVDIVDGITINNAAALSGGDYVIVGERLPFIEFVDFTSNTATKEYILHAHGQQAGNVYLKTRTSSETITIPQNATAAEVETLCEATSDCVSATATGGPWPLLPIMIELEWSASSGDISAISATASYSVTGTGTVYSWNTSYDSGDMSYTETITVTSVTAGSEWSFQFNGAGGLGISSEFVYTATTTNPLTFIASLKAALSAYQTAHAAEANWSYVVLIDSTSNVITITYQQEARLLILFVDSAAEEDSRRAGSCAASYSTSTGEMTSAVGFEFGRAEGRTASKMFAESAAIPTVTGLNVLGISSIGSGPGNSVVINPDIRNNGDNVKSNVVEKWDIASGVWSFDWQVYCNAKMLMPTIIACESDYVICSIGATLFDGVNERTAAKLAVADGAVTELNTIYGSITSPDNWILTIMADDSPENYCTFGYDISTRFANRKFLYNPRGADTWIDGDELRLGASPFGFDSSAIYAAASSAVTSWNYPGTSASAGSEVFITFYANHTARSAEPQQFRFKLDRMPSVNYTAWLDWYSTQEEIETALDNLLGAGNCSLIDFGLDPTITINSPVALIEHNPMFRFLTDVGFTPGSGRIPGFYFVYRNSGTIITGVEIEMQTITPFADPAGIAAYDITDASLMWSRPFGTSGAATIAQPSYSWVQGDFVYAYGHVVDAEL